MKFFGRLGVEFIEENRVRSKYTVMRKPSRKSISGRAITGSV
jgi:hypothetical protein